MSVTIYPTVKGQVIQRYLAERGDVQRQLRKHANAGARVARAALSKAKVRTGDSQVYVAHGDIDYYIVLDDTAGENAAWAIERFGVGPGRAVHPLRAAREAMGG